MKDINMAKVTKRFNDLMYDLCLDHLTIGTSSSENTDGWNLRDMVSETQYQLDIHFEDGNLNCELRYESPEGLRQWRSEVGKLRRFIDAYKPYITDMKCVAGHCSKWDNHRR